ncbi:hypothetical protein H8E06_00430 [bacterium]|nr:hypothetical protein [bacterium]
MSRIENKSSQERQPSFLKEYQFFIIAAIIFIGIFVFALKDSADDLKKHEIFKLQIINAEQEYQLKQKDAVIQTQLIILRRQQDLIQQMETLLRKLAPPGKPIDPDNWTYYEQKTFHYIRLSRTA